MANPQIEKGHTRIANEILEQIMQSNLNGTQLRIVMAIWRYTYGFQRKEHQLSLSFLAKAINTRKSHVDKELTVLIDRKIITAVGIGKRGSRVLSFNKNHDEWLDRPTVAVQSPPSTNCSTELSYSCSTEPSYSCSTKKERTKENIKKNTRQQKTYDEDSSYFKMAQYFYNKVSIVAKEAGVEHLIAKANLQKWSDDFRKLIELDGVDKRLAKEVMDWVTQDSFWRTNVLSAKKFREKFTELAIKMRASHTPKQQLKPKQRDPRDKEIEFQKWIAEGNDPDAFDWRA